MTDRGLPIVDGAPACPFVAFEDDRDARATSPDHRHRCYAEVRPAQRALAHQEAYCLSSAFPVCPTFQDWARREAAAARSDPGRGSGAEPVDPSEPPARREPRRGWSEPPPWVTQEPSSGSLWDEPGDEPGDDDADAGSDSLADLPWPRSRAAGADERPQIPASGGSAGYASRRHLDADDIDDLQERVDEMGQDLRHDPDLEVFDETPEERSARRRAEREGRGPTSGGRRPAVGATRPRRVREDLGPTWERPRRYEAYPTIRTRIGLPGVPRLPVLAVAVLLAGIGLFFLPTLLGIGGPDAPVGGSPSPSSAASSADPSASLEPTVEPAPTPVIYVVKSGDNLSAIARSFGVSLEDLLAANADTITDPNKIKVGDRIVIPTALPTSFVDPGASESLPPP